MIVVTREEQKSTLPLNIVQHLNQPSNVLTGKRDVVTKSPKFYLLCPHVHLVVNVLCLLELLVNLLTLGHYRVQDADVAVHGVTEGVYGVPEDVYIVRCDG